MSHLDVDGAPFKDKPYLWIQWKGTDVCCDIHCACGESLHYDGDFLYYFICGHCNQRYETGSHVAIYPVAADPTREDMDPILRNGQ